MLASLLVRVCVWVSVTCTKYSRGFTKTCQEMFKPLHAPHYLQYSIDQLLQQGVTWDTPSALSHWRAGLRSIQSFNHELPVFLLKHRNGRRPVQWLSAISGDAKSEESCSRCEDPLQGPRAARTGNF